MTTQTVKPLVVAPARFSMSFLRASEGCMRRAHLDRVARVPADGDALTGSLFHEAVATIGFVTVMQGHERPDPDRAREITRATMRRHAGPLPRETHAAVLDLIDRWAGRRPLFRQGEVFEVLSVQPLAGWELSAKFDRYYRTDRTVEITDAKTGWADAGTRLTMQGECYAWHAFEREPDLELVVYSEDHIRTGIRNGPYELARDDIYGPGGIEEFLRDAVARLEHAYTTGDLPATPGTACSSPSRCPHAATCPVPEWARLTTTVDTRQDAERIFAGLLVQEARRADDTERVRGYLNHTGERALALNGEEIGMAATPGQKLDRRQLERDIEAGVPIIDLADYTKTTNPSFGRRRVR